MPDQPVFDKWLTEQPDDLQDLLRAVRAAILAANPDFTEALKWGTPNYWLPDISRRTICMINVHRSEYVRVQICNGASIPDPQSLLEGTGKFHRHIKLTPGDQQALAAVTPYTQAAETRARHEPKSLAG